MNTLDVNRSHLIITPFPISSYVSNRIDDLNEYLKSINTSFYDDLHICPIAWNLNVKTNFMISNAKVPNLMQFYSHGTLFQNNFKEVFFNSSLNLNYFAAWNEISGS